MTDFKESDSMQVSHIQDVINEHFEDNPHMTTMDEVLYSAIKEYADNHFKDDTIGGHACKFIIDEIDKRKDI